MLELIFSRDSKNKELNSYLFSIMCLAVLKVVTSIICSKYNMGFIFHTSVLTFIINFIILMLIQLPKDKASEEYLNKVGTAASAVSLFLFIYVMVGLGFMMVSKFKSTSISEGILYVLTLLSEVPWVAVSATASEELGLPSL